MFPEKDTSWGPHWHVPERAKGEISKLFLTSTSTAPLQVPPFSVPWARGLRRSWGVLQQLHGCDGTVWGRGRKRDWGLRTKQMSVIPKPKESIKQKNECNACFDRESGESVSWTWTSKAFLRVNSIHLLSALFLTLMDQAGAYKANGVVPSIDFI